MSYDPIRLEVFKYLFAAIAEEMGAVLRKTSYSPNIKERRDFSCAVFDAQGRMISQAAHIPVHLGSMPLSVAAAVERFPHLAPGDVVILNDPYQGGTHLPDITLVTPVFYKEQKENPSELISWVLSPAGYRGCDGMTRIDACHPASFAEGQSSG
jgi:N-methylhydantoinase B